MLVTFTRCGGATLVRTAGKNTKSVFTQAGAREALGGWDDVASDAWQRTRGMQGEDKGQSITFEFEPKNHPKSNK